MSRSTLPNRRAHETFRFEHWGQSYIVGIGRAQVGSPILEVFINCAKSGTQAETLARDSAVILSLALQHGVPVDEIRHALTRDSNGDPSGPMGALVDMMGETV